MTKDYLTACPADGQNYVQEDEILDKQDISRIAGVLKSLTYKETSQEAIDDLPTRFFTVTNQDGGEVKFSLENNRSGRMASLKTSKFPA